VAIKPRQATTPGTPPNVVTFVLTNTGTAAATDAAAHPSDASAAVGYDIYRMSVTIEGKGWTASLPNALAAVKFGASVPFPVSFARAPGGALSARMTLKAVSESDPTKTATAVWTLRAPVGS